MQMVVQSKLLREAICAGGNGIGMVWDHPGDHGYLLLGPVGSQLLLTLQLLDVVHARMAHVHLTDCPVAFV